VELYPGQDDALEIQALDVRTEGGKSHVTLKARVYPGQQLEHDTLPALLVYTDGKGARHGIDVPVPLASLGAAPAGKAD